MTTLCKKVENRICVLHDLKIQAFKDEKNLFFLNTSRLMRLGSFVVCCNQRSNDQSVKVNMRTFSKPLQGVSGKVHSEPIQIAGVSFRL